MIGIKLVLLNFFRIFFPNLLLGFLLADSRIQLTHLRSLPHLVSFCCKELRGFYCSALGRSPYDQGLEWIIRCAFLDQLCSLLLTTSKESLTHPLSVFHTLC